MACVRGAHATQALVAVERQTVGAEFFVEEVCVEGFAQGVRARLALGLAHDVTQSSGNPGGRAPGAVDIGLYLDQGDRTSRKRAVRVEDGIVAVLPALVRQPLGRLAV